MLVWLDGRLNVRARPQENFGRELMELFTTGVGHYTEEDVYAAARVFTGWNLRLSGDRTSPLTSYYEYVYNANQHDPTAKTFTFAVMPDGGRTIPARAATDGEQDGIDLIRALARRPETAERLARKLYAFFVSEFDAPDDALINDMRETYLEHDTSIRAMLVRLFTSNQFLEPSSEFSRYAWPVEYVVKAIKETGWIGPVGGCRDDAAREHGPAALRAARRERLGARARVVLDRVDALAHELRRRRSWPTSASTCSRRRPRRVSSPEALLDFHLRALHAVAAGRPDAHGAARLPAAGRHLAGHRTRSWRTRPRAWRGSSWARRNTSSTEGRHELHAQTIRPGRRHRLHVRLRRAAVPHRAGAGAGRRLAQPRRGVSRTAATTRSARSIPYGDPDYYARRPTIGMPAGMVQQIGTDRAGNVLGLHPALSGLKSIFDSGKLAVIQRTGYQNSSRSHFQGFDIYGTANPSNSQGTGWLGRYLDTLPSPIDPLVGWNTTRETPRALQARTVGVPAITEPGHLQLRQPERRRRSRLRARRGAAHLVAPAGRPAAPVVRELAPRRPRSARSTAWRRWRPTGRR